MTCPSWGLLGRVDMSELGLLGRVDMFELELLGTVDMFELELLERVNMLKLEIWEGLAHRERSPALGNSVVACMLLGQRGAAVPELLDAAVSGQGGAAVALQRPCLCIPRRTTSSPAL